MDAGFLERLLGNRAWTSSCVVIIDSSSNVDVAGPDSIVTGGQKNAAAAGEPQRPAPLADAFGESKVPLYVMNVTYPLVDKEFIRFCAGKKAILIVEEGQPDYIEQNVNTILRRADIQTRVHGKDVLPMAGEYTGGVVRTGIRKFIEKVRPDLVTADVVDTAKAPESVPKVINDNVHGRPPSFCTGCPERPVFSAMKILRAHDPSVGDTHVSADIGCHTFSTQAPFNVGNSVLGYGMGLASSSAVSPLFGKRTISVMGDGGFWHNGLTNGVANAMYKDRKSTRLNSSHRSLSRMPSSA